MSKPSRSTPRSTVAAASAPRSTAPSATKTRGAKDAAKAIVSSAASQTSVGPPLTARSEATPRSAPPSSEVKAIARKNALKSELDWLHANGQILTSKRARPKMTYTQADIDAMNEEDKQSPYVSSSGCSSSDDDDSD